MTLKHIEVDYCSLTYTILISSNSLQPLFTTRHDDESIPTGNTEDSN